MLDPDEERSVASAFGVATSQVRRDHLISHVLAVLSERFADRLLFFGGTALSRTRVPNGRLSEDIDLIALGSRTQLAADLDGALPRALRREFPGSGWRPALSEVREEAEPASLIAPGGMTVRIQLLRRTGYPSWPHGAARARPALLRRRPGRLDGADAGVLRSLEDRGLDRPGRAADALATVRGAWLALTP
ncbi:nucleotidyl transferase AbiEii/AbiGii toxin family protein [Jiangella anatolica]|uniref:nucleotidyl transferase AbiEii/AbiGii toxin family protein n=1 Tax=Jiangella anatolica TaxID=2670374 RepID=UPI0018F41993|nr:nucleotidyl transferase AbiEii/AbiGii toxin family protein [Jiangella anatolica]